MLFAVAAQGPMPDSLVEPVFGRADWFILVAEDGHISGAFRNPHRDDREAAGQRLVALLAAHGVTHVLCGECGSKARIVLADAGMTLAVGVGGTVRDAMLRQGVVVAGGQVGAFSG